MTKVYSDGTTPVAVGDTIAYFSGIGRIAEFLPPGDSADIKLTNGDVAISKNCKRIATEQEVF